MNNLLSIFLILLSFRLLFISTSEMINSSELISNFLTLIKIIAINLSQSQIFYIFVTAFLTFLTLLFIYFYQRKFNEGRYLSFTVSYISSQMGSLYSLKRDHLMSRYEEVLTLEKQFKSDAPYLKLREIANIISNPKHSGSGIDLEKLSFLVDADPNLLVLTKAAFDADAGVDEIVQNCNMQVREVKRYLQEAETEEQNKIAEIWLLICFNKCLYEQVDHALGLLTHAQEQLIKYIKSEFKHFSIIKNCSLDDSYAEYKPTINNSFLEVLYVEKNTSLISRITKIFNRFRTCF